MVGWTVHHGDCREVLKTLADSSIDAVVTDPPYHLTSNKAGGSGAKSLNTSSPAGRARIGTGFMGKAWDGGDIAHDPELWAEVLRVAKPGAHLLAFGGTRTYHRLACAIEDAGWEVRDCIAWLYGSGFPKSLNLEGQWGGWGTALKPAMEPIVVARKPLIGTVAENMQEHGVGALNIDGCRISTCESLQGSTVRNDIRGGRYASGHKANQGDIGEYQQSPNGRWPANVIHDGSAEVVDHFPLTSSGKMRPTHTTAGRTVFGQNTDGGYTTMETYGDSGSAARFFYVPKADREDRDDGLHGTAKEVALIGAAGHKINPMTGRPVVDIPRCNSHPTVKPTDLMRYLCRLVTPPGGIVLDPFMGSGSTGRGASIEGLGFIGIEQDAGYCEIARKRIAAVGSLWTREQA